MRPEPAAAPQAPDVRLRFPVDREFPVPESEYPLAFEAERLTNR